MPKPVLETEDEVAQGAYESYAEATGGKTFDGRDMPAWTDLGEKIQGAWRAAAAKAISMRVDYGPQRWHDEPDSTP